MSHDLTPADIAAVTGNNANGFMNGELWNNPFIYLVWLAVLGNGGIFGNRNGYGDAAVQGALTRSDLFEGFNNQDVNGQLRGITNGLCDGFYAINNSLKDGFYGTQANIKDCCCTTNRNIDAVRFDMSKGFCDVAGAIHAEGEATRALINANTVQELRDKLEARDRDILARDFQLSQLAQNQYLVNEIRPCAKPAYITCSPYTTASFCGCGA
jgi:hypothetical protein